MQVAEIAKSAATVPDENPVFRICRNGGDDGLGIVGSDHNNIQLSQTAVINNIAPDLTQHSPGRNNVTENVRWDLKFFQLCRKRSRRLDGTNPIPPDCA